MEYYPIYIAIKKWIEKHLFLSLSIITLSITAIFLIYIKNNHSFVAGKDFEQSILNYGKQEIFFEFDKNMIRFGSYETNSSQWLELMGLSFDPPQTGNIRSISGDRFAFVFDTPIPPTESLSIYYNSNLLALDGSRANLFINYTGATNNPFVIKNESLKVNFAFKEDGILRTPVILNFNLPVKIAQVNKALSIFNQDNKPVFYKVDYDVITNQNQNKISCIQTNYNILKVYPFFLNKNQDYNLILDYSKISNQAQQSPFEFKFSTFPQPQWLGLAQSPYFQAPMPRDNSTEESNLNTNSFIAGRSFWLIHNTEIANAKLEDFIVSITPAVSNLEYELQQQGIKISGDFESTQEYQLSVTPEKVKDIYNQKITNSFNTTFTITSQKPAISQIEGLLYIDRKNPIVRYQTLNVTNITIAYQIINSAYHTAISLYGRNVPVSTLYTNITVESVPDKITWQEFDLSTFFTNNNTMLVHMNIQNTDAPSSETNFTKILASTSGLSANISLGDILIQAKDIATQQPLELMMISIWDPVRGSFQDLGRTKSDGTLRIPNPKLPLRSLENPIFIGIFEEPEMFDKIAFLGGKETTFTSINESNYFYSSPQLIYNNLASSQEITAMISTDRANYKQGEDISVHVLARGKTNNNFSAQTSFFSTPAQVTVFDPSQQIITNFNRSWSGLGSINFKIRSNQISQLGLYSIRIQNRAQGFTIQDNFTVESIIPKNTEITFDSSKNIYLSGETLAFELQPRFLFGTPIPSQLSYYITGSPISFYSKKYPLYNFGSINYLENSSVSIMGQGKTSEETPVFTASHKIVERSGNNLQLSFYANAESTNSDPMEVQNQTIRVYQPYQLGIYTEKTAVINNETILFDLLVLNPVNEEIISNKIFSTVTITKESEFDLGVFQFITNYLPINTVYQKQEYQKNLFTGKSSIEFTPKTEGKYQINYSIYTNGTRIQSELSFIVLSKNVNTSKNNRLRLELDKPIYESGEKAFLYINNPFPRARLLLTIERDTIREFYTFISTNAIITHPVVLTYQDDPGVNVTATLTSISNENTPSQILYGSIPIPMKPDHKTLRVVAQTTKSNYMPQEEITINISAYNNFNQAIDGEAFVVVRDKAVLSSEEDSIDEPINNFYSSRPFGFTTWDSGKVFLDTLNLTNNHQDPTLYNSLITPRAYANAISQDIDVTVRSNFPFTLYSETVKLSKDQDSSITFTLPDNITAFDISVLAYDNAQLFGKTNINITSSKKLIVEDILPLFVRPNDTITWGAYIRNLSTQDLDTIVILDNTITTSTQKIKLLANSSTLVTNTDTISTNSVAWSITALSPEYQDKVTKILPIISENPWLTSSYSGIVNTTTNIQLALEPQAQQHSLQIQVANTPIIKIKTNLQNILNSQSLSLESTIQRILTFLGNEDLFISNNLININKAKLKILLQKDISRLNAYYVSATQISLIPNGTLYSNDPMYFLQLYEILLNAQFNRYIIDVDLLNKLYQQVQSISKRSHPMAQAYAYNLLALSKSLDIETFRSVYTSLPANIDSQAFILDTMYKLGFPLRDISAQTQTLAQYLSQTGSEVILQSSSRFTVNTFMQYYGDFEESIKLLNFLDDKRGFIHASISFLKKYPQLTPYQAQIALNEQTYNLSEKTNQIKMILTADTDIKVDVLNASQLFYNVLYSYIPTNMISRVDSGFKIEKNILPVDGQDESPQSLEKNQEYTVELKITPSIRGAQQIEIIIPQYAGARFVENQNIRGTSYVIGDDKVYLYTRINTETTIRYNVTATQQGIWTAPPISVNSLSSPEVFGIQTQNELIIK